MSRLARALWLTLLAVLPTTVHAQGGGVLSSLDRIWERWQHRNPWMYQIDNEPWKTWLLHGGVAVGAGGAIAGLTPATFKTTGRVIYVLYFAREIYNITIDGNRKYFDATMDVVVPVVSVETVIWLRGRRTCPTPPVVAAGSAPGGLRKGCPYSARQLDGTLVPLTFRG